MGKFDSMLLLSDYDNTLLYTEEALRDGTPRPPMSRRNLDAIARWMEEGGRFAVATGRALEAFRRHAHEVPMNAPIIVDNGGAIYDLEQQRYVVKNFLPDSAPAHIAAMAERFPGGRLVFDAAGPTAVKLMLKTWVRQAGIRDVGAYFSVQDAEKELPAWSDRITVSSRGYMLGYQDLRGPGISNIHRLLARIADGPLKLRIVRMEFQASDSERSTHNSE